MRHYEIVVLVRSGQQERVNNMVDRYKKMVTDKDGAVHRFEDWGNRPLAYPIGRQLRAHYFLMNIECEQEVLDDLRENFRFSESVIRFLVVRREEAITAPSPIVKEMANSEQEENAAAETNTGTAHAKSRSTAKSAADSDVATDKDDVADKDDAAETPDDKDDNPRAEDDATEKNHDEETK